MQSNDEVEFAEGTFPQQWIDGTDPDEPQIQVHLYARHTWIMRESLLAHWEAPFLYLFAGEERALLVDTGASGAVPLRGTVDSLIGVAFPLVVAHSHAHGDHIAGDMQFADRPDTVIVGHSSKDVADFFGIGDWPTGRVSIDLGGRKIVLIPIPGHEPASIALYDKRTRLLLTGDSLYPGRLYVRDFAAFRASIERLVALASKHEVNWVLGCHIEMPNEPGVDFKVRSPDHPNEKKLQLGPNHLLELRESLRAMGGEIRQEAHDNFIVVPR